MGSIHHGIEVIEKGKADAIAMANILHYSKSTLNQIREHLAIKNIRVRKYV